MVTPSLRCDKRTVSIELTRYKTCYLWSCGEAEGGLCGRAGPLTIKFGSQVGKSKQTVEPWMPTLVLSLVLVSLETNLWLQLKELPSQVIDRVLFSSAVGKASKVQFVIMKGNQLAFRNSGYSYYSLDLRQVHFITYHYTNKCLFLVSKCLQTSIHRQSKEEIYFSVAQPM